MGCGEDLSKWRSISVVFFSLPLVNEDRRRIVDDWQFKSLREREANDSRLRREKSNIKMGLFWFGDQQ
jgi:hypothetical protein